MLKNVYTVGQVNSYIKNLFCQDFLLKNIAMKGEISNCKYHTSGHIYFTLKDETSGIRGIMFASDAKNLTFKIKNGDHVTVLGNIQVYERDGVYQIYVKKIEAQGVGELHQKYEALKQELEEMGMFSELYKKEIPKYAKKIGIVTASTGAAICDIQKVAYEKNPYVQLYLYPAKVQGDGAAQSIVDGIQYFDHFGVDVILLVVGEGPLKICGHLMKSLLHMQFFNVKHPLYQA